MAYAGLPDGQEADARGQLPFGPMAVVHDIAPTVCCSAVGQDRQIFRHFLLQSFLQNTARSLADNLIESRASFRTRSTCARVSDNLLYERIRR